MSNLLTVILLNGLPGNHAETKFWQAAVNVIQRSTYFNQKSATAVDGCGVIQVFRSLDDSQAVLSPLGLTGPSEGGQETLTFFFESLVSEGNITERLEELVRELNVKPCRSIFKVDCRVYRPYIKPTPGQLIPKWEGALVINCMTPSTESEVSFNKWYTEEHIPMLRAVPGWRSSKRYVLVESRYSLPPGMHLSVPKYLALHEWVDDGIFGTVEYKAAVDTPWRTEVMAGVENKQRLVLKHIGRSEGLSESEE